MPGIVIRRRMKLFYTDHFVLPLPDTHRFPMAKYRRLRERVDAAGFVDVELCVPSAATDEQLLRAHDAAYLAKVKAGELTRAETLRIGFPWSPEMVERSRRSSGATIAAGYAAFEDGVSANLAGGTHHAGPDWGEGYCVFNDSMVAARDWQANGRVRNVVVIDLDVHQGNGTAAICRDDPSIFTFSMHGAKNFPLRKHPGTIDIDLPDGLDDAGYLALLQRGLEEVERLGPFDLVIYLAGADPYVGDRLGRLALSKDGLQRRDQMVLEVFVGKQVPVAIAMAGGYSPDVEDIVDIHAATIRVASTLARRVSGTAGGVGEWSAIDGTGGA